ncbi:hypothetical protein L208DRAFT_1234886 [Tricholoma matsutake]|nr:hypothetical protein L208DRAFT_1234886 [Tricholoma matsutake 945]
MSSINIITMPLSIMSLKMLFIIFWKVRGLLLILKNMTSSSKDHQCMANAAFHSSPFFICTLLYPHRKSNFVKTLAFPTLTLPSSLRLEISLSTSCQYPVLITLPPLRSPPHPRFSYSTYRQSESLLPQTHLRPHLRYPSTLALLRSQTRLLQLPYRQ